MEQSSQRRPLRNVSFILGLSPPDTAAQCFTVTTVDASMNVSLP